jgi:hypothetical protein
MIAELLDVPLTLPPWQDPARVDRYDLHVHDDQDAVNEQSGKFVAGAVYYTVTAVPIGGGEPLKQWRHETYTPARAQFYELTNALRRRQDGLEVLDQEKPDQLGLFI